MRVLRSWSWERGMLADSLSHWYWLKMKTTSKRRYNLSNKHINVMKFSILRTHRVRQKTKGTTRELPSSNIFQTVIQSCWLVPRLVPSCSICTWVQGFVLKYAWKNAKKSNFLPVFWVFPFPIFESVWWAPERLTRRPQLIGPIFNSGWRSRLYFFWILLKILSSKNSRLIPFFDTSL